MGKSLVVINVLDVHDYGDCHIKGSISVPLNKLQEQAKKFQKDAEIVVYCASYSSTLSTQAGKILINLGFADVKVYEGGAAQWYQLQFPIEGVCQQAYLGRQEEPEDRGVPIITAKELKKKMEQSGLF